VVSYPPVVRKILYIPRFAGLILSKILPKLSHPLFPGPKMPPGFFHDLHKLLIVEIQVTADDM
jgi:hypothetical protein